jgi:pyruvate/2-oxoglutarate dehydrogenase complex dihydrolipoamide dehydrogenase (E3) component
VDHYHVAIIGGGQAGIPLAFALASAGKRAALIERKHLGGSCLNFGCTPTKTVIASARVAHLARRGGEFGLRIPTVEVDFAAVIGRARDLVASSRSGLERQFAASENPKWITGHGRIAGRDGERFRITVGPETIVADQVVLDTGTRSTIPPIEGIKDVDVIHAGNWLERDILPQRLIVIGGGVIALEMAQFYRRMGSQVVVVEATAQIAGSEDLEVAQALQKILEREGIAFRTGVKIERVSRSGSDVVARIAEKDIAGTHLFVAAGRTPNSDDLGLETVGVKTNRGIVEVDERLATNVPGIWAAGDLRGGPMFTHTAWDDHRVLLSQIVGDRKRTTRRIVPYAIFTDPEVGRVGLTEREARQSGTPIKIARYEIGHNSKALEIRETDGFIKIIAEESTGQIVGATVMGNEGAELVHIFVDAMNARAPYTVIRDAIFIHPTLAEAVQSAAMLLTASPARTS